MKQTLQLKIGQNLTMTPQLQQAIRLLQLSSLELQAEIQETLDTNPLLEQEDSITDQLPTDEQNEKNKTEDITEIRTTADEMDGDRAEQTIPDELAVDSDWDDIYDPTPTTSLGQTGQASGEDFSDLFENQAKEADALYEHLLWQLDNAHLTETDHEIGMSIIDGVDDRGYLTESLQDIHEGLLVNYPEVEMDEVEAMLHFVQQFDPLGVAARNPSECMRLQLEQRDPDTPNLNKALALVTNYLDYLAANNFAVLKRRLQASDDELRDIIKLIQTTNPHPGQVVSQNHAEYIKPDVYVSKVNGEWQVKINPESAPRLSINDTYAKMVKRGENSEQNNYLRNNLQEARWFIKSLQSRTDTLLRVARSIVEHQHGFLDYGDEAMKPMVLRDIAEELEMHESTISRVTTMKYMHTPRGVLEFKYFFSSHVSTASGGECSATAIRAIIKKLIAAEHANKPLSDSKIAAVLDDQGIQVARRTIAKYREALNIPPSNERKRLF